MLKWALEAVLEIGKWRQVVKNKNAHTLVLLSPPFCRWGNWGLERCRHLFKQVSGGAETGADIIRGRSQLSALLSPPSAPQLLQLAPGPSSFLMCPWSCQILQDTGQTLGLTRRQQELLRGHTPINPVSFGGPFPRQRVTDIIISIFFNANYFFFLRQHKNHRKCPH